METAAQCVAYDFNIDHAVPLEDTISYGDLGRKVGLSEKRVRSIVRGCILNKIFSEPVAGEVAHTSSSALLVHSPTTRDMYGHYLGDSFPVASKLSQALKQYPDSTSAKETAFNIAFGTDMTVFEYAGTRKDLRDRFIGAMDGLGNLVGYSLDHIVHGFDWGKLNEGSKVVDVCRTVPFS